MPAPTSFNDWDTNGTHTIPVISGHTTDGFINNEIPGSAELNQWMMLTGQWTRYLNSLADFRWHWMPAAIGSALVHFGGAPGTQAYVSSAGSTGIDPAIASLPLNYLPVGAIISGIGMRVIILGGGTNSITLGLYKLSASGTGTITTPVFTQTQVPTGSYADYTYALTTNETIDADSAYFISCQDAGGNNINLQALAVRAHA